MHTCSLSVLGLAAALLVAPLPLEAAPLAPSSNAQGTLLRVQNNERAGRDCTPTNGPYGFYGNIWCQPPNVRSYERNLSSSWPQKTPRALKEPKPHDSGSDW